MVIDSQYLSFKILCKTNRFVKCTHKKFSLAISPLWILAINNQRVFNSKLINQLGKLNWSFLRISKFDPPTIAYIKSYKCQIPWTTKCYYNIHPHAVDISIFFKLSSFPQRWTPKQNTSFFRRFFFMYSCKSCTNIPTRTSHSNDLD